MPSSLKGIAATPVTPFTPDDRIDWETYEKLIHFLIGNGANLLAVPLHIGESLNLSLEERKQLAEFAVKAAAGRLPVIINVGLPGTGQVVDLARHAERVGADGVIAIAPYHWAPPREGLLAHFAAIGSAVGIKVLAYNFPRKIGVTLTQDLLLELIDRFENFVGMKDASYDMQYFTETCRVTSAARPGFAMFTGVEYVL
ncbi:MAG TPA: dihydrodipicolinate synthase family protein, partial [bacterium]|nr:dihydrodipicolinate synthase family protein [bacterium]